MKSFRSKTGNIVAGLGARAVVVTGAYVAATVAVLLTVIVLRGAVSPQLLRNLLGFIFIASLAAGLEPGTIKAAALGEAGVDGAALASYLGVGALKGALASPFLAILWRLADPTLPVPVLAWTPVITIAGFCATDLRVLLDLRGRYALAVGLKQGSLAGGVALVGLLLVLKAPLVWAIGVSSLIRLGVLPLAMAFAGDPPRGGAFWTDARRLLRDSRWLDLAAVSLIAAVGGSVDRMIGLRLLGPSDYSAYYLIYEVFTKFWLVSYILGPILFARQATGTGVETFVRGAFGLTVAAGAGFLAVVAGVLAFGPGLLARVVGASFGWATFAFAVGVVIGAFVQLWIAQLQGAGQGRRTAVAMALSAAVSAPVFWIAAGRFGAEGLLWAFLAKTALELAMVAWRGRTVGIAD